MQELMKYNPAVHRQDISLEVPDSGLVDSDIDEASLYRFIMKTRHKMIQHSYIICKG